MAKPLPASHTRKSEHLKTYIFYQENGNSPDRNWCLSLSTDLCHESFQCPELLLRLDNGMGLRYLIAFLFMPLQLKRVMKLFVFNREM